MAKNDVAAAGPTRGASYVLPWDAMAQYDQMVSRSKEQYEAQNQQKLAAIADMEKQDLTGMPSYDKALEDHYEKLHGEMGKIITKYRDPFQSLDGMRELKSVQAKYIANPIVNNAKTTEESFKALKADLANNIITKEDFDVRKAEYDQHITDGDITKPFIYQQPNYDDPTKIVGTIASSFDKTFVETANSVKSGFSDEQIGNMYDAAFIDKSRDRFLLGVENYAKTKGYGEITDDATRKKIGQEYIRMILPWKTDMKERNSSGDGNGLGGTEKLRTMYDAYRGSMDPGNAVNYVDKNADGSLNVPIIGFGVNQGAYSYETQGKYKLIKSDNYNSNSKQLNSTVVTSKAQLFDDVGKKIQSATRALGVTGQVFNAVDNPGVQLSPEDFDVLGIKLGFSIDQIKKINEDYVSGEKYNGQMFEKSLFDGVQLAKSGLAYSPTAFLNHIINTKARISNDNDVWTPEMYQDMAEILKIKNKSDAVYLDGVQLNAQINSAKADNINTNFATGTPEERRKYSEALQRTNTPRYEPIAAGQVVALNDNGRYIGFSDLLNIEQAGRNNLAEVFDSSMSDAALLYYKQKKSITNQYKTTQGQKSILEHFFVGLGKQAIGQHLTFAPEGKLSVYQMAEQIKARQPEMKKNGEMLSEKEKMILDLCQEFDNMR